MVNAITLVDRSIAPEWLSNSRVSCRSACEAAAFKQLGARERAYSAAWAKIIKAGGFQPQ